MKRWLGNLLPALIALSWQGSPDAIGYKIYYGPSPGVYTHRITVPTPVTNRTVNVTVYPAPRYFIVRAYNDWGEATASNEIKVGAPSASGQFQCTPSVKEVK